jgi:hypothetical protein
MDATPNNSEGCKSDGLTTGNVVSATGEER